MQWCYHTFIKCGNLIHLFLPCKWTTHITTILVTNRWNRRHLSWIFSEFHTFTLHTFVLNQMYPSPSPMLSHAYFGALRWLQIPNQHWGGENRTSVSRFLTCIVARQWGVFLAQPCRQRVFALEFPILRLYNERLMPDASGMILKFSIFTCLLSIRPHLFEIFALLSFASNQIHSLFRLENYKRRSRWPVVEKQKRIKFHWSKFGFPLWLQIPPM